MSERSETARSERITDMLGRSSSSAMEMQDVHDSWFGGDSTHEHLYGSPGTWEPIKRSGHERRMAILDGMDLGALDGKVAADFGVGPWGFACVFPALRGAGRCIGFDVSARALATSADVDKDIARKTEYFTSDGETIPIADDSVDIFWAGEVIEHVREPRRFLQEVARVCREGARVYLSTPNRDAVYYKARGEDYAIGPEHIALLNHTEFKACLDLFFEPAEIVGYETSLSPELDATLTDDAALALVQERAYVHPQSASGLIAAARVDKKRYRANRLDWNISERLWRDAVVTGGEAERLTLFETVAGGAIREGQGFHFSAEGDRLILLFWAHDWSGEARITIDGREHALDLYSRAGGFRRFALNDLGPGAHRVSIEATGRRNPASRADQVIFYKAVSYRTAG